MARILGRTLCLMPFESGPGQHQTPGLRSPSKFGFQVGERYDLGRLSRFVPVASMEECMGNEGCNGQIDTFWKLMGTHQSIDAKWRTVALRTKEEDHHVRGWSSANQILSEFEGTHGEADKCMVMAGLFPGLRWRGPTLALAPFLEHTKSIQKAATGLLETAFGNVAAPFAAVHWRFWESHCEGYGAGPCFMRCNGGANPAAPEFPSPFAGWANFSDCPKGKLPGVILDVNDIAPALLHVLRLRDLSSIYLATDGWMRKDGCAKLSVVVNALRGANVTVSGLWRCPALPALPMGLALNNTDIGAMMGLPKQERKIGNHLVSLIEQELCIRSTLFIGSAVSTWSIMVQRKRLGERLASEIQSNKGQQKKEKKKRFISKAMDDLVVNTLLKDDFAAGILCEMRATRHVVKEGEELAKSETVDMWLDSIACDGSPGGPGCIKTACF
eukprot:TRINITY_DN2641_c0_g1_i1.p1 TRINITY_DN2641_c0_g1~~TRINITY_DN2641_c0_g1_i1.p1  ORF type:complete len:504 (-),score=71.99 TRINITY_DN2641_c0_g1_i1:173-1501(-)